MELHELNRTIELADGTVVPETFCTYCLTNYVHRVDELDYEEHQFEHLTHPKQKYFTIYDENAWQNTLFMR